MLGHPERWRWGLASLTARDAAARGTRRRAARRRAGRGGARLGGALTLAAPRTDDALAGVAVPVSRAAGPAAALPSHLQEVQADLISRQYPAGQHPAADALPAEHSGAAYTNYIRYHAALEGHS